MTESTTSANIPATSTTGIRPRYAPPNQRSRSLSRRKSGERLFDKMNNPSSHEIRNVPFPPVRDHGVGSAGQTSSIDADSGIITLNGCSRSRAIQLLTHRWVAAMQAYNDPSLDPSEKPVMYSGGSTSAWGNARLTNQMDFLTELRRTIREAEATPNNDK